ncbi:MAG: LuxR C-terminal-related transcriptional regulator [Gemmataceae bacterium]|nr:LuxR C-terminal-related transcriptional regulator [Gemmataceae bacterium]
MTDPPLDSVLRRAFDGVDDEDVRLFYAYFDELKRHARSALSHRARQFPGDSHVAQSALFSLFADAAVARLPFGEVDAQGYPMLWPLLLRYIERHCEKWKKYHRAKKRQGTNVPLDAGIDPPDPRSADEDIGEALAELHRRLTPRQQQVAALSAEGRTLEEIARELDCSESLVSLEKKKIRAALEAP